MNKEMEEKAVLDLYLALDAMGVRIWIDGGWSVDASLGAQSRRHADLDIAIEYHDLVRFRRYMGSIGYKDLGQAEDTEWNFRLGDREGHEVDVHVFRLDENGQVIEGIEYPERSLTGIGIIGGHDVRCIDPTQMIIFHTTYAPKEKDFKDVAALCEKFGITYPKMYTRRK